MAKDKEKAKEEIEIIKEETVTQDTIQAFVKDYFGIEDKYIGEVCEAFDKPIKVTKVFRGKPELDEKGKPKMILSKTAKEAQHILRTVLHSIVRPWKESKALKEAKEQGKKLIYTVQ